MRSKLIINNLCYEYGLGEIFKDQDLIFQIGSAINNCLNDGFEKGKANETPLIEVTKIIHKYNINPNLNKELLINIRNALEYSFFDGYIRGKRISDFCENAKHEETYLIGEIIKKMAKPEDLLFMNYLTDNKD